MKDFKRIVRNFFGFTRAQTNGFVVLLFLIIIVLFSNPVYRWWLSAQPQDFTAEKLELDSLVSHWNTENKITPVAVAVKPAHEIVLFDFDPNTVKQSELLSLGFPEKLSTRLINYRTKGGKFKIKTDVLRLYGMDSAFYVKLVPYIQLPEKKVFEKEPFAEHKNEAPEKLKVFNLNEADTSQLQRIHGIGRVLANRIIKYRSRLGGFVTQAQLGEVYGIDSTVLQRVIMASFLPEQPIVNKLNLNAADEKILATHPYFSRKIAAAIVAYRFQHGKFNSVDDLEKINLIDEKTLEKIYPYITVDP